MGGSFKSHGNCSPVAEYNYWCDPDAAALVYDTLHKNGKMIHMIGLDVTRKIVLTPTLLEYICRLDKETGEFIRKITKFYFDFHWEWEHIIGCVINDPLAVAYFLNPDICQGFDSYVQIETEGIISWTVRCGFHEFLSENSKYKSTDRSRRICILPAVPLQDSWPGTGKTGYFAGFNIRSRLNMRRQKKYNVQQNLPDCFCHLY